MQARRWFQFRLRTLFLVTTVIAVLLGLVTTTLGPYLPEYRRERQAMTELFRLDPSDFGTVSFGFDYVGPAWLRKIYGDRYFSRVSVAGIHHDLTEEDIRHLKAFEHLKRLHVEGRGVLTDAGLRRVRDLPQLRTVVLGYTDVSEDAIAELQRARPDLAIEWHPE